MIGRGPAALSLAKGILFDLDGTLLGLDIERFMPAYFEALASYLASELGDGNTMGRVMRGIEAMLRPRDDRTTNEKAFRAGAFGDLGAKEVHRLDAVFAAFYEDVFPSLSKEVQRLPGAATLVRKMRAEGYRLALATNPLFPRAATLERIRWAGLSPEDFALITTFESSPYAKPDPRYYRWVMDEAKIDEGAWMVGNDTLEDGAAKAVGLRFYLVNDSRYAIRRESRYNPDAEGPLADVGEAIKTTGHPIDLS